MEKAISSNTYDKLLFLLILCLPLYRFGTTLGAPGVLLTIAYIPFLLEYIVSSESLRTFLLFFICWFLYGIVSIAWTPFGADYRIESYLLFIHSTMFLEILVLATKANRPFSTIANAWTLILLLTTLVGLWEITTDQHLFNAREESEMRNNELGETMFMKYAAAFFYNYNTFCWFMCLAFPFVLYNLSKSKTFIHALYCTITILFAIYIMLTNASRGGLISIGIMLVLYFVLYVFKRRSYDRRLYTIASFFVVIFIILSNRDFFETILFRLEGKNALEDNSRLLLWGNSLSKFLDSYGFGQGVGSMIPALKSCNNSFIYYSHNMILEFLLVYGVFVSAGFIYLLWKLFIRGIKTKNVYKKIVLLAGIIPFPFYSVINSENLRPMPIWCFFASICVFALYLKDDDNSKELKLAK